MNEKEIEYLVPLLSADGLPFIPSNDKLKSLQGHLVKKFPGFRLIPSGTVRLDGHRLPVGTVKMKGTLPRKEGERLIRMEVQPFVLRWIQENNRHLQSGR